GARALTGAVRVSFHRSRLQGTTKGQGCMTAVGVDGATAHALLAELQLSQAVCVAGYNSSRGATLAGDPAAMASIEAVLADRQVFYKRLGLDYAFHSTAMDPIRPGLRKALADLAPQSGDVPFYSTVTGELIDGKELDAEYWWRNVRQPVQFQQAIDTLVHGGENIYVEIGPHPVLRSYITDALAGADRKGRVLLTASR